MSNRALLLFAAMAGLLLQPAVAVAGPLPAHQVRAEQRDAVEDRREKRREQQERRRERREQLLRDRRSREEAQRPAAGSAEHAARIARQRNGGGRVLSVTPERNGYSVRLLKDGEVRSYWVEE